MNFNYDKIADAIYWKVKGGNIKKSLRINDRLVVDVDENDGILGIELLDASSQQGIKDLEKTLKKGIQVKIA